MKKTLREQFSDAWNLRAPDPTHLVDMMVEIPAGSSEGSAVIPCAMQTVSHSIDVNPSLVKAERCPECGGKVPLAEIKETRYKSCPVVTIRLNAPAPRDLSIPITFGIYKNAILMGIWIPVVYLAVAVPFAMVSLLGAGFLILAGVVWWFWMSRRLWKWYRSVRPTLRVAPKA